MVANVTIQSLLGTLRGIYFLDPPRGQRVQVYKTCTTWMACGRQPDVLALGHLRRICPCELQYKLLKAVLSRGL